jgi:hypothetical protein
MAKPIVVSNLKSLQHEQKQLASVFVGRPADNLHLPKKASMASYPF